jgi:hypothetical protein
MDPPTSSVPLLLPWLYAVVLLSPVVLQSLDVEEADKLRRQLLQEAPASSSNGNSSSRSSSRDFLLNLDLWTDACFPTAVAVAVVACVKGVKRWVLLLLLLLLLPTSCMGCHSCLVPAATSASVSAKTLVKMTLMILLCLMIAEPTLEPIS